ncbi:general stress protein [Planococcus salinus]|uniref:general stress protein n=1 Tax=Planococcus salinus TaxID=1848460 RepID=UPI001314B24C|nr:general stress protein [Planococcus salinus]
MNSKNYVLAVVYSEEEVRHKVNELQKKGYDKRQIHIMANNPASLHSIEGIEEENIEEAGSLKDQLKGFITGESSVREGIKSLGLSEEETERYTAAVARGGFLLSVEKG